MKTKVWFPLNHPELDEPYVITESGDIKILSRPSIAKYCSPTKERLLRPQKSQKGYMRTVIRAGRKYRWRYIHRLVALTFIPLVDGKNCVNHKDGNKLNNHVSNLEWCTDAENNKHASATGLFIGANGYLTKEERLFIMDNFITLGRAALAERFNKSEDYIVDVFTNRGKVNGRISLRKVGATKEYKPKAKEIINTETGEKYISKTLASVLNTTKKEVCRMLTEERKPNMSPFRYTGRYVPIPISSSSK